jgi:hypothetical protein
MRNFDEGELLFVGDFVCKRTDRTKVFKVLQTTAEILTVRPLDTTFTFELLRKDACISVGQPVVPTQTS